MTTSPVALVVLGTLAGLLSGIFGVGGGLVMVPALVLLFGMTQHMAQGTSLAVMLPPVGLLAVLAYYKSGNVNVSMALWIGAGFLLGALGGAVIVQPVSSLVLKRIFGVFLMVISLKMIWGR